MRRRWISIAGAAATPVAAASFDSFGRRAPARRRSWHVADLAAFGAILAPELAAVGALLKYVELTQIGKDALPARAAPDRAAETGSSIDAATRASLELLRSLSGEQAGQPARRHRPHG